MAGYSGTPLPKKLGIKEGSRIVLAGAPGGWDQLGELPLGARLEDEDGGPFDVAVVFVRQAEALPSLFATWRGRMTLAGGLWIAWPRKAGGFVSDLDENLVREAGLAAGMVDNKVCAISEAWSGLRFVFRLKDRPLIHRPTARSQQL